MAEGDDVKFGNSVVTIQDREFTKDCKEKGKFKIRIPLPFQKAQIIASTASAIGGKDHKSLRVEDYEYIRMIITLNSVITEKPDWWDGADNCPDDDFLFGLWRWYIDCEKEFGEKLKKK